MFLPPGYKAGAPAGLCIAWIDEGDVESLSLLDQTIRFEGVLVYILISKLKAHGLPQNSITCCLARFCSAPPTPGTSSGASPSWFNFNRKALGTP